MDKDCEIIKVHFQEYVYVVHKSIQRWKLLEMNSSEAVECQEFYGTPQLAERMVSDLGNVVSGG